MREGFKYMSSLSSEPGSCERDGVNAGLCMDSGLDHGLDYGLEYGLNSRLIFKLLAMVASQDLD